MISKNKNFAEIQTLFLAEITNLRVFSGQKKVISKKKKGLLRETEVVFRRKLGLDQKQEGVTRSVFSSASLFPRNLMLYSTELCTSFSSHQPALKS